MYRVKAKGKVTGKVIKLEPNGQVSIETLVKILFFAGCFSNITVEQVKKDSNGKNVIYKVPLTRYISKKETGGESIEKIQVRI